MSQIDPPPRNLPRRKRLVIEEPIGGGAAASGRLLLYAAITAVLVGLAAYMAVVERHHLTSPYVAGPGIGALWFALRLFMIWGSNARG